MKIYHIIIILSLLVIQGCIRSTNNGCDHNNIDSLNNLITELKDELKTDKQLSPHIQVRTYEATTSSVVLYIPWGFNMNLSATRPNISEKISLIVPAAYTSQSMAIDGFLIENGRLINNQINTELTGICIVSSSDVNIKPFSSSLIDSLTLKDSVSVFQQSLLLLKKEIIPCTIFGNLKFKRRAIVQFEYFSCVAESNRELTILEFQEALKFIGVINAINLDMGSWSEGAYRDHLGNVNKIGDNFLSTQYQTSWLYYYSL